ncbi:electron transport complex subunit RsxG [Pseudomonas sp. ABC1]|uniref:electron transport complex subunit RsxG n=1 Tax=Pseudomonas sp. ABC1 TaxID=2748080 RepID=UPI0015C2DFFE|nr:electron transport complex subunit RsxG [Pseudomonas sp. ABC1]QLF94313.1 electron transport complex subunit RsxG [Pseudomonas sp. ABC1]
MKTTRSWVGNGLVLLGIALLGIVILGALQRVSAERIEQAERDVQNRQLNQLLPPELRDDALLDSRQYIQHPLLGDTQPRPAYAARKHGKVVAVILPATAADGYNGSIRLQVAILADGRISAVAVVEHRETPGMGDRIEAGHSDWLMGFHGKSLNDPTARGWTVKKQQGEFDQFAGATITPRAVVHAVQRALQYFSSHERQWLDGEGQP